MAGWRWGNFVRKLKTAAAAKSLQSYPALCDPIDGSPPGSPVPGILQARTLEWAAISFSNAGKWKWSRSVVSDSRSRGRWSPPGKSTGVGCILKPPCFLFFIGRTMGFPKGLSGNLSASAGDTALIPDPGRFPEEGRGNHSRIFAWQIPCTEENGGL